MNCIQSGKWTEGLGREWAALKMESAWYCASRSAVITIRFGPSHQPTPISLWMPFRIILKKEENWQKKWEKKNDQSLRCELAETKLASSLLYLLVVPKYIYIYRRKKIDITLHSLSDTNIDLASPLYNKKYETEIATNQAFACAFNANG